MKITTRIQLSVMMFLEFFIWGSWFVTLGSYLKKGLSATDAEIGPMYTVYSIAAIISPFFMGGIADRFFASQRLLGVLHLIGAVTLYWLSTLQNIGTFYWVLLLYTMLYMPTLALSNAVAFRQMTNGEKEFSGVRIFGTIGWIIAGLTLSFLKQESSSFSFLLAAGASVALGIYSFFLPDTPPQATGQMSISQTLGLDALVLLKKPSFLIFFICSVLICIPLSFYYNYTNVFLNTIKMSDVAGKMSLGQVSETLFMLLIPVFFARYGIKTILLMGISAWVLRYLCFAYGNVGSMEWLLYLGIILHGVCYDFFFVSGYIYTETQAGERIKSSAQSLFTFATYGVGMLIGSYLSGYIAGIYTTDDSVAWQSLWFVPAGIAAGVLVLFLIFFKEKKTTLPQS
jgi:nucleoside transporter